MSELSSFRALIADDEPLGRDYLCALVKQDERFEIVGACQSGFEVVACARDVPIDVAFLDIRMPGLDGFQTLETLRVADAVVVFVTAYSDYAVRAYDCSVFDFVTKPIDPARFAQTLNRVSDRLLERRAARSGGTTHASHVAASPPAAEEMRLLAGVRLDFVYTESEIEVIESQGNYVNVRIRGEFCLVRESLESFCRRLVSPLFLRVHRSFAVNMGCVRKIRYGKSGTAELILADGYVVPVSRRHRTRVADVLRATLSSES